MLITFTTKVSADITMFGEVAKELLKLMGQTGVVPGALLAAAPPNRPMAHGFRPIPSPSIAGGVASGSTCTVPLFNQT